MLFFIHAYKRIEESALNAVYSYKSRRYLRIANGKAAVCCLPESSNGICYIKKKFPKSCHHQLTMADMVRDISTGLVLL